MRKRTPMKSLARNLVAVALVCSLAISVLAPVAWAAGTPGAVTPAITRPFTLHGSFAAPSGWGFGATNISQPGPAIAVDLGDVITFTLFSQDNDLHNLVIDLDNDNTQDSTEPASPDFSSATTSISWEYTANTAGTFQYICGYHGGGSMRGSFTVRSTGTPPAGDNTLLLVGGGVVAVVIIAAAAGMMMRRRKPKGPAQP